MRRVGRDGIQQRSFTTNPLAQTRLVGAALYRHGRNRDFYHIVTMKFLFDKRSSGV